jgi:electron transport complex protein RnfC
MLIGKKKTPGSANVHATVPGKVVRTVQWDDSEGRQNEALVIRMEGEFEHLGKEEKGLLWENAGQAELGQVLDDCGIVEMEGSGKPITETLSAMRAISGMQTLVVRCVFDDPWLAADYVLCQERLKEVVEGSFIVAKTGGTIERIVFAVSHKEKEIGQAMLAEGKRYDIPSALVLTGSKYPQRNHRELELALRTYEKKEGVNLGQLFMLGPATLAAVHDAIKYHRPTLDRYVAVGGSAVKTAKVMKVRIGKRIADLFEECGGFIDQPSLIAVGSPLSGNTVTDLNEPIGKTSYAVFAMLKADIGDYPKRDCISCGECRNVCPVGLDPEELYKRITVGAPCIGVKECHHCGCCEIVCPSHLPLSHLITKVEGVRNA